MSTKMHVIVSTNPLFKNLNEVNQQLQAGFRLQEQRICWDDAPGNGASKPQLTFILESQAAAQPLSDTYSPTNTLSLSDL